MRKSHVSIAVAAVAVLTATFAWAQQMTRKAGLWEMATVMTLQQSPFPPGMPIPPSSPFGPGPRVTSICLTQEMIDRYGAPVPATRNDCQLANIKKGDRGMTAELVCTGRMAGKGDVKSELQDPEHATGSVHFTGTIEGRAGTKPVEWTTRSTSVFKGTDCGAVKPVPLPEAKQP